MDFKKQEQQNLLEWLKIPAVASKVVVIATGRKKARLEKNTVRYLSTSDRCIPQLSDLLVHLAKENRKIVLLASKETTDPFSFTVSCKNFSSLNLEKLAELLEARKSIYRLTFEFLEEFDQQVQHIYSAILNLQGENSNKVEVEWYDLTMPARWSIPEHLVVTSQERAQDPIFALSRLVCAGVNSAPRH